MTGAAPLLDVQNLSVSFRTREGTVQALDAVSFSLYRGEALALVGESGSGKSVSAFAVMGVLDAAASIRADRISLDGIDLLSGDRKALAAVRGKVAAMIFQNARAALNPIRP
ncbi:MAG: ATP-binding cassette domain-containing protein, partial [Pseudomonadota bacterium]